jgi:TRAP transporter TAXI family solute receptor
MRIHFSTSLAFVAIFTALTCVYTMLGQQHPTPAETGYAVKKPVIAASGRFAPWGSIAEIFKKAMQPYGWDIQVCSNCAGGPEEARFVFNKKMPPPLADPKNPPPGVSPPPNGPIDFGVTTPNFLWWAYQGSHHFVNDGAQKNLRLIGLIQNPMYLFVAVKAESGITDLSQIKERRQPVRIVWDEGERALNHCGTEILEYYGSSQESIKAAGGFTGSPREERKNFDIIIMVGGVSNVPEFNMVLEASQKYDLKFLQLPNDLLDKLAKDFDMERREIPINLLRGVTTPIPTVAYNGNAIYGRTDMPDAFAYTAARALDEHRDLFLWALEAYSYDPKTVWKAYGVPLHPGAARYYREKGYMK